MFIALIFIINFHTKYVINFFAWNVIILLIILTSTIFIINVDADVNGIEIKFREIKEG